ncbi:hypothetical protein D7X25_17355 [bacterium 1XD42-8]|nr:hypothetical protein D7X25_17355 [bacterium 1XD42-8]
MNKRGGRMKIDEFVLKLGKKMEKKPLLFWLIMNAFFLLISIFLFHPYFETNDDAIMALMAEGAYGQREEHLVYMSIFAGKLLKLLYGLCPSIRWYSLVQYGVLFSAFTGITYVLARSKREGDGYFTALIFLLAFFTEGYVALQYTKTGAIAAFGAYALLFYGADRKSKKSIGVGILLGIVSSCLRFKSFLVTLPFGAGVGIFQLYKLWKRPEIEKKEKKEVLRNYVLVFACFFGFIFFLENVNLSSYKRTEGWKEYWAFNKKREEVMDYQKLDYVRFGEVFEGEGVSENDVLSYSTWQFAAPDIFHLEWLENILDATNVPITGETISKFVRDYAGELYKFLYSLNTYVIGGVSMFLIKIFYGKRRDLLPAVYGLCLFFLLTGYFLLKGRWTYRTSVIFFMGMFFLLVFYWENKVESSLGEGKTAMKVLLGVLIFLNAGIWMKNTFDYKREVRESMSRISQFNEMISRDKEHFYLIDTFTDPTFYQWTVFSPEEIGCYDNVSSFGTWMTNSPIALNILKKYGIDNCYKGAYMVPEALVVDNFFIKEKLLYIKEHYGVNTKAKEVEEAFGFHIYKVEEEKK